MAVLLETSLGDLVIDLKVKEAPKLALNFVKLCKLKQYNETLFYFVQQGRVCECGDPTNSGMGGSSVFGELTRNPAKKFIQDENCAGQRFNRKGMVAMANKGPNLNAQAFFITLTDSHLPDLDGKHSVIGQVVEGLEVLD